VLEKVKADGLKVAVLPEYVIKPAICEVPFKVKKTDL
jgi:hypothetical protein